MKKFIALTLALLMVLSLCACGAKPAETPAETPAEAPAEQPAEAPAEEIVINFPSIWVGTDSKANYMAKMVEDFNAENAGSIKVVVEEQTDYQAYRDKIRTLVTTGDVPDVCILDGTYDVQAYTASGKFMDFAPYLADGWGEDFTEGFADPYTIDGQTCILPFESAIFPSCTTLRSLPSAAMRPSPPPTQKCSICSRPSSPRATTQWVRWPVRTAGPPCSGTL